MRGKPLSTTLSMAQHYDQLSDKVDLVEYLNQDGNVATLAREGYGLHVVQFLEKLDDAQKTAVLTAPGALKALCDTGWALTLWEMLEKMPDQNAVLEVLSADYAIPSLYRGLELSGAASKTVLRRMRDYIHKFLPVVGVLTLVGATSAGGACPTVDALRHSFAHAQADVVALSPSPRSGAPLGPAQILPFPTRPLI